MSYTTGEVLTALKTGLEMIDHKSPPNAIRAFMAMACEFYTRQELLYAMDYLPQYRPLLKYL